MIFLALFEGKGTYYLLKVLPLSRNDLPIGMDLLSHKDLHGVMWEQGPKNDILANYFKPL